MNAKELRLLENKLKDLMQLSEIQKSEISQKQKQYFKTIKDINNIQKQIDEIKTYSSELIISDHAVLRYLERVKEIDVEEIKKEIITPQIKNIITTLGTSSGTYPSGTGYSVVFKKNTAVTILVE